jgi:hypothetical protein
MRIKVKVGER